MRNMREMQERHLFKIWTPAGGLSKWRNWEKYTYKKSSHQTATMLKRWVYYNHDIPFCCVIKLKISIHNKYYTTLNIYSESQIYFDFHYNYKHWFLLSISDCMILKISIIWYYYPNNLSTIWIIISIAKDFKFVTYFRLQI